MSDPKDDQKPDRQTQPGTAGAQPSAPQGEQPDAGKTERISREPGPSASAATQFIRKPGVAPGPPPPRPGDRPQPAPGGPTSTDKTTPIGPTKKPTPPKNPARPWFGPTVVESTGNAPTRPVPAQDKPGAPANRPGGAPKDQRNLPQNPARPGFGPAGARPGPISAAAAQDSKKGPEKAGATGDPAVSGSAPTRPIQTKPGAPAAPGRSDNAGAQRDSGSKPDDRKPEDSAAAERTEKSDAGTAAGAKGAEAGSASDKAAESKAGSPDRKNRPNAGDQGDSSDAPKQAQTGAPGATAAEAAGSAAPTRPVPAQQKPSAESTPKPGGPASGPTNSPGGQADQKSEAKRAEAAKPPQPPIGDPKTVMIPKPKQGDPKPPEQPAVDPETVAIPKISNPSEAATTILPVQRPSGAGPSPITKPPATPRPGTGPKNPAPQGPAGPAQAPPPPPPPRPSAAPQQVGGAPSPADTQPTDPAAMPPQPPVPPQPRPLAQPQRVPPAPAAAPTPAAAEAKPRGRRPLIVAGAAVVAVIAIVGIVLALVQHAKDNSPQAQIRSAITGYTDALASGNLNTLRGATCGQLHDFYQNIAPDQYAGVHKLSVDQKKIPKIGSVDNVQITGDKAVAQASVYTDADPTRVARTFDLQQTSDGWKVCDPPNAGR
ncbi:hypothetical protein [Nocardia terpenica]|uniref:Rv0361 family membrane protein n=1 Tax=Nocardia terpenica TaxID=455432 RepID=UPI002FDF3F7C